MGASQDIKSLLDATLRQRYGEGYSDRVDLILKGMLRELEARTGKDASELERHITRYQLISRNKESITGGDSSYTHVSYMASQSGGGHTGPLDWIPHTCHLKIELCWPIPDDFGLIHCLEIEIPWPCPNRGPITILPIIE